MKKRIRLTISIFSIIIIVASILISIRKGLFHDLFQELRGNHNIIGADTITENAENNNGQKTENQTELTASESSTQPIKMATYDEKLFYHIGDDIYYSLLPSMLKGEMMVNVSDVSISKDMKNVSNPQYFLEWQKSVLGDYYFVTVTVNFKNVGATRVSWSVGVFYFASFDRNSQVNTYGLAIGARHEYYKVQGDEDIVNGEFFLNQNETYIIKYTGMVMAKLIDDAITGKTKFYFIPSEMYMRAPNKENALAFVELDISNIN